MDNMDKHRVLLTPTNNGKKYHLSPSSSSSSSPFQQRQKRRRRRQSPYTNKHNKKLNVNNKSPIDRLMSRFHKNTSPYKTSIPIKTIKKDPKLADCDLLIMLDLDDIGAYKIDDKDILDSIN